MRRFFVLALVPFLLGAGPGQAQYTSKSGGYEIAFPAPPQESAQDHQTPQGVVHAVSTALGQGAYIYQVVHLDRADEPAAADRKKVVQATMDGVVASTKATVNAQRELTIGGLFPGKEFTVVIPDQDGPVDMVYRVFNVGTRVFTIGIGTQKPPLAPEKVAAFLGSFKLVTTE